jgi:hypothetical protein
VLVKTKLKSLGMEQGMASDNGEMTKIQVGKMILWTPRYSLVLANHGLYEVAAPASNKISIFAIDKKSTSRIFHTR